MITTLHPDLGLTQAHWDFVERIICDLAMHEIQEDCAANLDVLLALHRKFLETEAMMEDLPGPVRETLQPRHKHTLEKMLELVHKYGGLVRSTTPRDPSLESRFDAFAAGLQHHWDGWYHPVDPAEVEALTRKIFDGAA